MTRLSVPVSYPILESAPREVRSDARVPAPQVAKRSIGLRRDQDA